MEEEIVSYLRQVGKEYGVFPQAVLKGPLAEDDEWQDSKKKGGATYIMLVSATILKIFLNRL